jgi:hypothetical protein
MRGGIIISSKITIPLPSGGNIKQKTPRKINDMSIIFTMGRFKKRQCPYQTGIHPDTQDSINQDKDLAFFISLIGPH